MPPSQSRVLVVGGSFAGLCIGRDLKKDFLVTIVDAKEFFEYTPGVLRAYVKPKHLDALTFTLYPVIEYQMGLKFIWGEVLEMKPDRTAVIKPMFTTAQETIDFDYSIIAAGCNFGVFHKWGESLWFPTIHEKARPEGSWGHIDERFLEGRRRHVLEEYKSIREMNAESASIMVVGAGFIGVEWVTELDHFFPQLKLAICDMLPKCLGPLPESAAQYCVKYMERKGINQIYGEKFDEKSPEYLKKVGLKNKSGQDGWDKKYVCVGVKASNYFMPEETLSTVGPGGGKWIFMDQTLAVRTKEGKRWSVDEKGYGRIYAVGDCNFGCVEIPPDDADLLREAAGKISGKFLDGKSTAGDITVSDGKSEFKRFDQVTIEDGAYEILSISKPKTHGTTTVFSVTMNRPLAGSKTAPVDVKKASGPGSRSINAWPVPPIPKISYPGEEEAVIACANIHRIEKLKHGKTVDCCYAPLQPAKMHWPWGAGMFATSLGPDTACFVAGANWQKNSGLCCVWGPPCAVQKEIIEASKTDECANGVIGRVIWHFVHHTPVHLFGGGPRWGY
jgi:hypothetical protein